MTEDGHPALRLAAIKDAEVEKGVLATRKTPRPSATMPLHPMLIRFGFLDFVAERRNHGHVRLFHELARAATTTCPARSANGSPASSSGWVRRRTPRASTVCGTTSRTPPRPPASRRRCSTASQGHKTTGMKARYGSAVSDRYDGTPRRPHRFPRGFVPPDPLIPPGIKNENFYPSESSPSPKPVSRKR